MMLRSCALRRSPEISEMCSRIVRYWNTLEARLELDLLTDAVMGQQRVSTLQLIDDEPAEVPAITAEQSMGLPGSSHVVEDIEMTETAAAWQARRFFLFEKFGSLSRFRAGGIPLGSPVSCLPCEVMREDFALELYLFVVLADPFTVHCSAGDFFSCPVRCSVVRHLTDVHWEDLKLYRSPLEQNPVRHQAAPISE